MDTPTITLQWAAPPTPSSACSRWTCTAGHIYEAVLQIVDCPSCKSPFIAVKLHNCPYCNEPPQQLITKMVLAPSNTLTPPCQEIANAPQSVEIIVEYTPEPISNCTLDAHKATLNAGEPNGGDPPTATPEDSPAQ